MTAEEAALIRAQAEELKKHLEADIINASTRIEHIRLTQHAEEAARLVAALDVIASPVVD